MTFVLNSYTSYLVTLFTDFKLDFELVDVNDLLLNDSKSFKSISIYILYEYLFKSISKKKLECYSFLKFWVNSYIHTICLIRE